MSRRTSRPPLPPSLPYHPFHSSALPSLSLEVGPLKSSYGSGERWNVPSGVWDGAPAEIEFGAFYP